ncbi:TsaE protein, required for threonylcarbamoyladenosine t(6)A37 formation in tRNA [Hydrogenimonas sp.]|nr:TsaE protein, required for threonylcarbamoyladenosine t(6)A37 formation in tRNA [Hydrogenimonas sp.]
MTKTLIASLDELDRVAEEIGRSLPEDAVIFLRGDLAAGKTTLAKALAEAMGYKEAVTSPTFSVQQIYGDRLRHYDLYQCPNEKFMAMGLLESLEEPGWHMVEWGDEALRSLLRELGFFTALVEITPKEEKRIYRIETDA